MSNNIPKVSVIMPTYNGARFIRKSIDSVLSQTFNDFELIIINDGSSDNTKNIIRSYRDKRIVYLENKKNLGVPKARNIGLKNAKGEYIAYCDHDDIYYPQHLKRLAAILDTHPDVGLVYAKYLIIESGKPAEIYPAINSHYENWEWKIENIIGTPLNVMHRIKCIHKVGGFDESKVITKCSCEDYDLWLRMSDCFKFYHLNETLGEFVYHGGNRTLNMDWSKSYLYVMKKRWQIRQTKAKRLKYIRYCGIDVIKKLLNVGAKSKGIYKLAREFHSTANNYQTIACQGLCKFIKGRLKEATGLFKTALKKLSRIRQRRDYLYYKDMSIIKFHLARAYYHLGKISSAIKICRDILKLMPKDMDAKIQLALCYANMASYRKALDSLKGIPIAHRLRAYCYFKEKKYKYAIREFKKAMTE